MLKIAHIGDNDGWVETSALASALGFRDDELRGVGIRLGWMRRFGMIEKDSDHKGWRLTGGGERVIDARLRAAQKRQLEELPAEAMIEVMANVTHRYRHTDPLTATLLRREFLFGTQPR